MANFGNFGGHFWVLWLGLDHGFLIFFMLMCRIKIRQNLGDGYKQLSGDVRALSEMISRSAPKETV